MNTKKQYRAAAAALAVLVLAALLLFAGGSWLEKRSRKPETRTELPQAEQEIVELLASRLTKAKILGTIDLLQTYRDHCSYNVGVGPTLGGFAVELEETL